MLKPDMSATSVALSVTRLEKTYSSARGTKGAGVEAVAFDLPAGTFFTLLGPSGCGKTTTLRCIAGLERPDSGRIALAEKVFFDSELNIELALNRRNIGMVFQSYAIWPHMTVFENVAFPLRVARDATFSESEVRRLVEEALDMVELGGFAARPATRLSGGQQQRVALARAVVRHPRLLLLDEPLSNLDAQLRDEMRLALKRLQRQIGVTTIYVTHDQSEALEMSDTIAVMNRGRIVQLGGPREIYSSPADSFVADFMGAVNVLDAMLSRPAGGTDGPCLARLGDGTSLVGRMPHPITGQAAAVSIRPEAIMLTRRTDPVAAGHNRLTGTVSSSSFLGATNRYVIETGSFSMQAVSPATTVFEPGAEVAVEFPHHDTLILAKTR